ncbi:MAG: class I SAM-dependent methyltransferase [Deltaproteobacteria bacterium]|jgi:hypothetical protein|nr:class I SAM-dependent methyltransferase [Deltaproteobacteria bacterium]
MCGMRYVREFKAPDDIAGFSGIVAKLGLDGESQWSPRYLVDSAWLENTLLAFWIIKTLRPKVLVELGTDSGYSYMAFCQAVSHLGLDTKCYAVDLWGPLGNFRYDWEYNFNVVDSYNRKNYAPFSELIRDTFDNASEKFSEGDIDLIHIDGTHTYDAVKNDFDTWKGKMSGRGVMLFHDINVVWDEFDFGVWRFWDEIRASRPSFTFSVGAGLGILGVGEDLPEPLNFLLSADVDDAQKIHGIFGNAGMNVRHLYRSSIVLPDIQSSLQWKVMAPARFLTDRIIRPVYRRLFRRRPPA